MLEILLRASIDGTLIVLAVWLVCRFIGTLSPSVKTVLWWCAAAKVVVALAWAPVTLPVLPAASTGGLTTDLAVATRLVTPAILETNQDGGINEPPTTVFPWQNVLIATWLFGVALSVAPAVRRARLTKAIISRSVKADVGLRRSAEELAAQLDLPRMPMIRLSEEIASPLAAGLFRPVVLLPASLCSELPPDQQRMALCHELVHLRRGDLWLGIVPAAAERIFFFHPLVRLAAREYAFWREAACDAAVLSTLDTAPQTYGRLLLGLGVARRPATLAAAGAAWSFSNLKRRIVMLRPPSRPTLHARLTAVAIIVLGVAAIVPFRLAARTEAASAAAVPARVWLPPAAAAIDEPSGLLQTKREEAREDDVNFIFMTKDHTTMSGSTRDIERARRHRQAGEDLLWFRTDGREYVVRDAALLEEVRRIWEPLGVIGTMQGEIGTKQGILGTRQGEIGTKQGELGTQQGILGTKQGEIATRQGQLAARESRPISDKERDEITQERESLERKMRDLDREMRVLDAKIRELEAPMHDLGKEMEILGREMEVLGRKMEEASSKAEADMRRLIEKAISTGAAQQVK